MNRSVPPGFLVGLLGEKDLINQRRFKMLEATPGGCVLGDINRLARKGPTFFATKYQDNFRLVSHLGRPPHD